ncbi:putative helicase mov-10-B.1 [Zerene cesonia]|uniref:putative helicase mov-10-B.1 n=1 Tax=Zerene cesonia TaxID=33412 RepID=UPI0018E4E5EA|nr:putative helicase mov-10-B.1 [Zerene cesonia]
MEVAPILPEKSHCPVCGVIDEYYDEFAGINHEDTPKHLCNVILRNYIMNKSYFSKNKYGVLIFGNAESLPLGDAPVMKIKESDHHKMRLFVKPNQVVKFSFDLANDTRNEDLLVIGVQLAHPQPQFRLVQNPFIFGQEPKVISRKSSIKACIVIQFQAIDIGHYEMPIMFTLFRKCDQTNLIFVREMVVFVQENQALYTNFKYPYTNKHWERSLVCVGSTSQAQHQANFKIPKLLKILLPLGLDESALEDLREPPKVMKQLQIVFHKTRQILEEGYTKKNYVPFFHHILWWEEIIARINLKKYNMFEVKIDKKNEFFVLEVPGLAEKRPSLLRGDRVYIRPRHEVSYVFESTIKEIEDSTVLLTGLDDRFMQYYDPEGTYDVRFLMSRVPVERMHDAINKVFETKQEKRVFPEPVKKRIPLKPIGQFFNPLIYRNAEQRSAVEHIVAGTSGLAPYIVFGPPGTGKTMTIVEAIIQLVSRNPKNRVMVCTDSNMAADHIALMLLKYNEKLNIKNFLLRANSQSREWTVMPSALAPVSNGTSYETFYPVSNVHVALHRVFVTTLLHAAKYATARNQSVHRLQMTHVFVDEAAQAAEPAVLVPVTGLLAPAGRLVLAGDPRQLGPVCISRDAKERGLGQSLLERLKETYPDMYSSDPDYITMLVNNFRSDPDILAIPNELFYDGNLRPLATLDPLSRVSILGLPGGQRATIFHAVNSREQRMGNAPSYFNEKELEMVKRYIKALLEVHRVLPKDIGVIAPYIRQVYKIKNWLKSIDVSDIEVGTVESFQGKEKRVIIVSTVRANCRLLEYDARYGLGFLVDDKRYNVTLTRAKAKLIIIGNPTCLVRDLKWRKYMDFCKQNHCYFGHETQQVERTSELLVEIARTRFDRCRLTEALKN